MAAIAIPTLSASRSRQSPLRPGIHSPWTISEIAACTKFAATTHFIGRRAARRAAVTRAKLDRWAILSKPGSWGLVGPGRGRKIVSIADDSCPTDEDVAGEYSNHAWAAIRAAASASQRQDQKWVS